MQSIDDEIHFPHAARRNYEKTGSTIQWTWLFRVQQLAVALRVPKYSEERRRATLPDLERLMRSAEVTRSQVVRVAVHKWNVHPSRSVRSGRWPEHPMLGPVTLEHRIEGLP